MSKRTGKIRNVIVAANLADASWRDFLTGFFGYARTGVHWDIRLLQSVEELAREADNLTRADGIVSGIRAETRLTEVKRRLRKTKQSIRGISRECGFANPNHLKNLFKRHFGMSMREYRRAAVNGLPGSQATNSPPPYVYRKSAATGRLRDVTS